MARKKPNLLKQYAAKAATKGRGGDTMLAHINSQEAAMLKQAGGSGSINPHTGLPEFMTNFGHYSIASDGGWGGCGMGDAYCGGGGCYTGGGCWNVGSGHDNCSSVFPCNSGSIGNPTNSYTGCSAPAAPVPAPVPVNYNNPGFSGGQTSPWNNFGTGSDGYGGCMGSEIGAGVGNGCTVNNCTPVEPAPVETPPTIQPVAPIEPTPPAPVDIAPVDIAPPPVEAPVEPLPAPEPAPAPTRGMDTPVEAPVEPTPPTDIPTVEVTDTRPTDEIPTIEPVAPIEPTPPTPYIPEPMPPLVPEEPPTDYPTVTVTDTRPPETPPTIQPVAPIEPTPPQPYTPEPLPPTPVPEEPPTDIPVITITDTRPPETPPTIQPVAPIEPTPPAPYEPPPVDIAPPPVEAPPPPPPPAPVETPVEPPYIPPVIPPAPPYIPPTPVPAPAPAPAPAPVPTPQGMLNPGWMNLAASQPFYQTTNNAQGQFYWGAHNPVYGVCGLANYNNVPNAPATPWGKQGGNTYLCVNSFLNNYLGMHQPTTTQPTYGPATRYQAPAGATMPWSGINLAANNLPTVNMTPISPYYAPACSASSLKGTSGSSSSCGSA